MDNKLRILVTGATGFVGKFIVKSLVAENYDVVASVRTKSIHLPLEITQIIVAGLHPSTDWSTALKDVDIVIHAAARAHVLDKPTDKSLVEFQNINTKGTLSLAQQAAKEQVKRFIYISSIRVNGKNNSSPFTEMDEPNPQELYAISKFEAEQHLLALGKAAKMEITIIRPPLVYGPNPSANFANLIKWVNRGIPLPFGAIHNQRSFVAIDNLVSFIIHCIDHPKAANEIFLIADGKDVSTTELLRKVANAFGKKPMLIPIPVSVMTFFAKVLGKGDIANRLFSSLQVDSSKARNLLGWKPVTTMDEQLKETADAYLNEKNF